MKTFKQFLYESSSDNAYVFDVDDTLVTTDAKILVKDTEGNIRHRLTPAQFNTYMKQPDEYLDLTQFSSEDIFAKTAKPTRYFQVIQKISDAIKRGTSSSTIYILTARGENVKDAIYNYLTKNGVVVNPIEIHTVGGDQNRSVAEMKKDVLQKIRDKHIGQITFFDDDPKNIALANQIKGITTRLVRK